MTQAVKGNGLENYNFAFQLLIKQMINSYLCENEARIIHPSVNKGEQTHALPSSFDSLGCLRSGTPLGGNDDILPFFAG